MRLRLAILLLAFAAAKATADPVYPRLANIYLHGSVDMANIDALARWDLLVLNSVWTEAQLAQLRARNPDILLYFYVCPYSVQWPTDNADVWEQANIAYAQNNDLWWYDRNSLPASDWPGSRMANITALGGTGPQGSWREYIAARITALVTSRPSLDGIMLDNFWKQLSWNQNNLQLDTDCNPTHDPAGCNGVADAAAALDALWNQSLIALATDLRSRFDILEAQRPRPLGLVGNGSTDYFTWINGSIHEAFPSGWSNVDAGNPYHYNWNYEMFDAASGYLVAPFSREPYPATIMNSVWAGTYAAPDRTPEFERHKRFTFVSTLLGDGFYSLDAGQVLGNGSLWWESEYDHAGRGAGYLGRALAPAARIGVPSGPELVTNGTFANATSGWSSYPFNAAGNFAADQGTGRITVQSVSPGGEFKVWSSGSALQNGASYVLSVRARADRPVDLTFHLFGAGCPGSTCLGNRTMALTTAWKREEIVFYAPGTATASLNLFVRVPATVWIDDVSVRRGEVSVYRRDFERGSVLLNYTSVPQTITLGSTYTRLAIPGSTVFDGASVSAEVVPPWDGRILLRTGQTSGNLPRPQHRALQQNEPNPFNPATLIRFELLVPEHVRLAILDVRGRLVRVLADGPMLAAPDHSVIWDGNDRFGIPARSGTYFYRLETPSWSESQKMTLLR